MRVWLACTKGAADFLRFCEWLQRATWIVVVSKAVWIYQTLEVTHYFSLFILIGTSFIVDLRVLGAAAPRESVSQISEQFFPWVWTAFCIVMLGGFLLLSATATNFITSPAFRIKLGILVPTALVWHINVQRKPRVWGRTADTPTMAKLTGLLELLPWLSVATAAVEIPNY
jgi:uncharacterized membrane protein